MLEIMTDRPEEEQPAVPERVVCNIYIYYESHAELTNIAIRHLHVQVVCFCFYNTEFIN